MKKLTKKAEDMTLKELAAYIDYSVLKPEFTPEQIIELTKDGVKLGCATICINPGYMDLCEPYVKGSETKLCPVTDFPFGTSSTASKVQQIEMVAKYDTVGEVDVVANFGKIRAGLYDEVTADIKACADAAHKYGRELKVIFERFKQVEDRLRKRSEGSGIGLSIVKDLINIQGGIIDVKSEFGVGSEFTVKLPVSILSNEDHLNKLDYNEVFNGMITRMNIEFSDIYI